MTDQEELEASRHRTAVRVSGFGVLFGWIWPVSTPFWDPFFSGAPPILEPILTHSHLENRGRVLFDLVVQSTTREIHLFSQEGHLCLCGTVSPSFGVLWIGKGSVKFEPQGDDGLMLSNQGRIFCSFPYD